MVIIFLNFVFFKNVVYFVFCVFNSEIYRNIDVFENGYFSFQFVNGVIEGGFISEGDGGFSCWFDQDVVLNYWEEYFGRFIIEINNYG